MVSKTTDAGRKYDIDGRKFIWTPEVFEGEDALGPVIIPLRLKLKTLELFEGEEMTPGLMRRLIASIVTSDPEVLGEMDVNDLQEMFAVWNREYKALTGAALGESTGSPA